MKFRGLPRPKPELSAEEEHALVRENRELHRKLREALQARVLDKDYERFVTAALNAPFRQPRWTLATRETASRKHLVVPVTNFSDWHLDEEVRPEEVQHKNGYNRAIAEKRLKLYFANVCKVAHTYVHGFEYPGIVFNMLGDNFSGFIHDELRRTNMATMLASLLHWIGPVSAGLKMLADAFGQVWVTGVVGNHGRYDKKPIAKMRAQENFDWLFMHLLKLMLEREGETRIIFTIATGQKMQFSIFDTRAIISHGDECKGGSGIAGMLSPQLIAFSRMKKTYEFDQWWIGHWHQLGAYRGIRVNGSGKGYDEYAFISNFDFQPPLQDFFLIAPRVGTIASWPIHCQCSEEPWAKARIASSAPFQA
jgi:hypothetical protein